jgi:2-isopropylmalate synthase
VLKFRENYEIMDPADVGANGTSIELTARSGRAALKHRLQNLGHTMTVEELDEVYDRFLELADKKKEVNNEDLLILIGKEKRREGSPIKVNKLQVVCGKSMVPTAMVELEINGIIASATSTGDGPVDASYRAVKSLFHENVHLEEYLVQAITGGSEDTGKVSIQLQHQNNIYFGFGADTDVVTASVEALVDAFGKIIKS